MHPGRRTSDRPKPSLRARRALAAAVGRVHVQPLEDRRLFSGSVVINEIHYAPDVATEQTEFVELTNPGDAPVDLSGASFTAGITYTFPNGTTLAPNAYVVVAQDLPDFQAKFGFTPLGPFTGRFSNDGETITIKDAQGATLDTVTYQLGFPWPTVGDSPGYSIELINPTFDNNLGGNWRALAATPASQTLIPAGSTWKYQKGTAALAPTGTAWHGSGFDDSSWSSGATPIGYDSSLPMATNLSDMFGNYTSVYLRKTFTISNPADVASLQFQAFYDDGFNLWVNGNFVTAQNAPQNPPYNGTANGAIETSGFETFTIPGNFLVAGQNVIAVHLLNSSLSGSSDAFLDARLIASSSGSSPTPGRRNAAFDTNAAPQMRQVNNTPQQPASNQAVTITAKVTDPQGVQSVNLAYQLVNPGNYIRVEDPAYNDPANWATVAMHDDGVNGDLVANDGTYSYVMPASIQTNRRLVRYRISSTDTLGKSITAPYADDPQQNFAYYVYDGVPNWSGSVQPGGAVTTYGPAALNSTAVYTLITRKQDHAESQYIPNSTSGAYQGANYLWSGTFVYDGKVYDGIHYRSRGGVWRYAMGKNMWKLDFNTGHELQARDAYGNPYPVKWSKLNLGSDIQQGDIGDRGEQGLFETLGFKLYNMAGAPGSNTAPVQFRIVENALQDNGTTSQYDDDFQGLYLAVEQDNGRLLDAHGLPDGNLYKMEGGTGPGGGTLNNQGPTQVSDNSDLVAFQNMLSQIGSTASAANEAWLRANVNLDAYYAYHAITEAIHNYDIGFGKNYFFYHNPVDNKWQIVPWDLDLTFYVDYEPGGGDVDPIQRAVLAQPALRLEFFNKVREIRDLIYNSDQVGKLADEYAALVNPQNGQPTLVQADRAMWDYNPILASGYVNSSKAGQGRFYQKSQGTPDFPGMVNRLKTWVSSTRIPFMDNNVLNATEEAAAPPKRTVVHFGAFTPDNLTFTTPAFAPGNQGGSFAAMQWRMADVTSVPAGQQPNYEVNAAWDSGVLTTQNTSVTIPASAVQVGHSYRVRVRFKDTNGRWGHWSDVAAGSTQFVVAAAQSGVKDNVRVTEVNYNPVGDVGFGNKVGADDQAYEFLELRNFGGSAVDLAGSKFTAGIPMTFTDDGTGNTVLLPGKYGVVVKDPVVFRARYGTSIKILGTYGAENLNNDGELITLVDSLNQTVQSFTYDDSAAAGWPITPDGQGPSLVVVNPGGNPDLNLAASWRASSYVGGSPGGTDIVGGPAAGAVVINEVLSHTNGADGDWIELFNTTNAPVDISGWFLSDDTLDVKKYQFPAGTILPAHGFKVVTQTADFGTAGLPGVITPFGLSEAGDEVELSANDGSGNLSGYRQEVNFGAAPAVDVTFGRVVGDDGRTDFWQLARPTRGIANSVPVVGPVVMNELMYAPVTGKAEFVELRNLTPSAVPLYDPANPGNTWRFTAGITFSFPAGASIPASGFALVVPVDPAVFRTQYNVPAGVQVFGPYTGALDNGGERVTISRPDGVEPDQSPRLVNIDTIVYGDAPPWPTSPDGGGPSLARTAGNVYTNDATHWAPEVPGGSPGRANFDSVAPTVTDMAFDYAAHPQQRVTVTFSENVFASLTGSSLLVTGVFPNGQAGDPLPFKLESYSNTTNVATFVPATGAIPLGDGNYRATLQPAGITDAAGNPLAAGRQIDFFVLIGDADHDRTVGPSDFNLLASNFGKSGQTWATGDFDGDGVVGPSDFNLLASHFGTTLIAPPGQLVASSAATTSVLSTPTPTATSTSTAKTKQSSSARITPRVTTARVVRPKK